MDSNLNKPMVSIIMPVYNCAKYIGFAIDSVIKQTYTNWELTIVNDGSTDNTQSIIDSYKNNDSRIIALQQKNGRQGKARNLAIAHASGKYLAFLDADDVWITQKLAIQMEEIEVAKADLVFSKSYMMDVNQNIMDDIIGWHIGYLQGINGVEKMVEMNQIPILTVLVKKELVESVKGFSEDIFIANVEDYHLWLKLIMSSAVFYGSEKTLAYYRIHDNSVSKNDSSTVLRMIYVYCSLYKLYPGYKQLLNQRIKLIFKDHELFPVSNEIRSSSLFSKSNRMALKKIAVYLHKMHDFENEELALQRLTQYKEKELEYKKHKRRILYWNIIDSIKCLKRHVIK